MKHEDWLFGSDPAEEEAALRRAEADIAAGRLVPHEEVAKWLRTWGTPESGPPPESWFK
jgi:predicted transcriptional regulator